MIISLNVSHSTQIAKIHRETLAGDFLPSLGLPFLKAFYEGIIGKPDVYGFTAVDKGKIQGFVVGTADSKKFFSQALRANFVKLSCLLLLQLVKNPRLIKNVVETFLYPQKETGPKAELVVIAVLGKLQRKGLGRALVRVLEGEFKKNGLTSYKLTVHANKNAVGFYEHLGYYRTSSFRLYGKMWFVYAKKISS